MVIQGKKKKLEYTLYSIPNQSTLDASYLNNQLFEFWQLVKNAINLVSMSMPNQKLSSLLMDMMLVQKVDNDIKNTSSRMKTNGLELLFTKDSDFNKLI